MRQTRLRRLPEVLREGAAGGRILMRAELNVPAERGGVLDLSRLADHKETLLSLRQAGCRTVVAGHYGRPGGRYEGGLSLEPVARALGEVLGFETGFAPDCVGEEATGSVAAMESGDILVLENTRFHEEEEANEKGFARALSAHGDFFVNDAFSVSHRVHASTAGVAHFCKVSCAGLSLARELDCLTSLLSSPERPVGVIAGGAKIAGKAETLRALVERMDVLAIGGAMANLFLAAKGVETGSGPCERDLIWQAEAILEAARTSGCEIVLPEDLKAAPDLDAEEEAAIVPVDSLPQDWAGFDIGPKTIDRFKEVMGRLKTVVWNGPLGVFEREAFSAGTRETALEMARLTKAGSLVSVGGGGETAAALNKAGASGSLSHVSMAGGAFLEWLRGGSMPVLEALEEGGEDGTEH